MAIGGRLLAAEHGMLVQPERCLSVAVVYCAGAENSESDKKRKRLRNETARQRASIACCSS